MARKKTRKDKSDDVAISQKQEDNLLDFLNGVENPDELICAFDKKEAKAVAKAADEIFKAREELGAFLTLEDFTALFPADSEIATLFFEAARRPLIAPPAFTETVSLLSVFSSVPFALAYPGPILFDIKWGKLPPEWTKFTQFQIALATKRLDLSQRLKKVEDRIADLNKRLKRVKATKPVPQDAVDRLEDKIKTADNEKAEIEREAKALNDLVAKKDLKGLFALIKRNIEAEIKSLDRQLKAAIKETPPDLKKIKRLTDQIEAEKKSIEDIKKETGV